jgi:hypothetical protein
MADLACIVEGIKIQYVDPISVKFKESQHYGDSGYTFFTVDAVYQIVGAYQKDNRIKVIVNILKLECVDFLRHLALDALKKKVMDEVSIKIPESAGQIDLITVREN